MRNIVKEVFTKRWLEAAGIRAIKTFFQTAVATIGSAVTLGEVNWVAVGSTAVLASVLSMLTSVAGLPELSGKTTSSWFFAAGIRALKTVAQTSIAMIGSAQMMGGVNWTAVASAAALSGIISIAMSLSGLPEVEGAK